MQVIRYAALGLYLGFLKMKHSGEPSGLLGPPERCCGVHCCKDQQSVRLHDFAVLLQSLGLFCSSLTLRTPALCDGCFISAYLGALLLSLCGYFGNSYQICCRSSTTCHTEAFLLIRCKVCVIYEKARGIWKDHSVLYCVH